MLFKRQFDQPVDELIVRNAARLPELRVHADLSESRHCIYLIENELPVFVSARLPSLEEEVDSREPSASQDLIDLDSSLPDLLLLCLRKVRHDRCLRPDVVILRDVVVELIRGYYFSDAACLRIAVSDIFKRECTSRNC